MAIWMIVTVSVFVLYWTAFGSVESDLRVIPFEVCSLCGRTYCGVSGLLHLLLPSSPLQIDTAQSRLGLVQLVEFGLIRLLTQSVAIAASALCASGPACNLPSSDSPALGNFSLPVTSHAAVLASISSLDAVQRALLYGTSQSAAVTADPLQLALAYGSACVPGSPADCASWQNGAMAQGLASALTAFGSHARALLYSIQVAESQVCRSHRFFFFRLRR